MITVHHHQEVTGEELAAQVLVVVMEAVVGTSQRVFWWGIFVGIVGKILPTDGSVVEWIFFGAAVNSYWIGKDKIGNSF